MKKRHMALIAILILTISLIRGLSANLDTDATDNHVIGIYHFESTQQKNNGSLYTPDSGNRQINGNLVDNANLTNAGKYGKSLLLTSQDAFCAVTLSRPLFLSNEYSVVAWVKLPKQSSDNTLHINIKGYILTDDNAITISIIGMGVVPSGNLFASHGNYFRGETPIIINSKNQNIANNRWHHIAFTRYANTLSLYIDGRSVASHTTTKFPEFFGNYTCLEISGKSNINFTGDVLVDDAGFFETGFSSYEIKGLYNDGLKTFLDVMPVNPQGRLTTTWGSMKSQR